MCTKTFRVVSHTTECHIDETITVNGWMWHAKRALKQHLKKHRVGFTWIGILYEISFGTMRTEAFKGEDGCIIYIKQVS